MNESPPQRALAAAIATRTMKSPWPTRDGPGRAASSPEELAFVAYLDFLAEHGHNLIRLWRWEQFRSQAAGGDVHLCMAGPTRTRCRLLLRATAARAG
jgi:hypothetical protein